MKPLKTRDPNYWEKKHQDDLNIQTEFKLFDLYFPFNSVYSSMIDHVLSYNSKNDKKLLLIGIGRSDIIETLLVQGFQSITVIDVSSTIISEMKKYYSKLQLSSSATLLDFLVMDVRDMSMFPNDYFNCILDKGCLDALFSSTTYKTDIQLCLSEIYRILKKDSSQFVIEETTSSSTLSSKYSSTTILSQENLGSFISISYAPQQARLYLFNKINESDNLDMSIAVHPVLKPDITYYMYIFRVTDASRSNALKKRQAKDEKTICSVQNNMNKMNISKSKENAGVLSISTSVDLLTDMIEQSVASDYDDIHSNES